MLHTRNVRAGKLATQLLTAYYAALKGNKCLIASPAGMVSITLVKSEAKGRSAETITLDEWGDFPSGWSAPWVDFDYWAHKGEHDDLRDCAYCYGDYPNVSSTVTTHDRAGRPGHFHEHKEGFLL